MAVAPDDPMASEKTGQDVAAGVAKAPSRPARQQLLLELDMQRQAQDFSQERRHDYFLSDAYPPSIVPLEKLAPVRISDLRLGTHHRGKVLIIRTLDDGCRLAAVQNVIEDETGEADRLAFFNADASLEAEKILPSDSFFAVKEPFYTAEAECGACVRIDHPTDLLRLDVQDQTVPASMRDEWATRKGPLESNSAESWKLKGNAAYSSGNNRSAVALYTRSIQECGPADQKLRQDVLRNRSIANILLKRFEQAQADAEGALIHDESEEKTTTLNSKAYYRAGRAAYELHDFDKAQSYLQKALGLVPADKDTESELKKIDIRQGELSTGKYNFALMSKSSSAKHNRLDFAEFAGPTEIRNTENRGRGLFATRKIASGELILVEKAFCVAFDSDNEAKRTYNLFNRATKRRSAGTQAILLFNATQKLIYSPKEALRFFDLYAGGPKYDSPLQLVDGTVPVDTFRVNGIIENNSFACPTVRSSSKAAQTQSTNHGAYHSTGLWIQASYINHSCIGNCMRSFMGDMIIIRASKDIAKGDEILMPYRLPDPQNSKLQSDMEKMFGFKCDCPICTAEAASPDTQRKERDELIVKSATILTAPGRQVSERRMIVQIEQHLARLEAAYESKSFEHLPRLGLVPLGTWLCQAYSSNSGQPREKIVKTALAVLRNMGFKISVKGEKLDIDRTNAQFDGSAIEAAMHAAHAYAKQGKANTGLGKAMEEFAQDVYIVMNGELRGFEENFGKI